jgi:hypothetical protein
MSDLSGIEIVECAKINFENILSMNPHLGEHPFFKLAMSQLENGIAKLREEDKCGD